MRMRRQHIDFLSQFTIDYNSQQKMSRSMVVVCCMCGDVGFADKLFRCSRCTSRFQHSYCSNYYSSSQSATQINICDWCQYDESINSSSSSSSRYQASSATPAPATTDQLHRRLQVNNSRSEYSGSGNIRAVKQHDNPREENKAGNKQAGVPSPRTATKRYKLLKDVMC